jgi:hypothetical protein
MGRSKRSRDDEEEEDEEFREEDQDQERESSAQKRKKKKNKKGKKEKQYEEVMKGQTEEERRQLRRAQRKVEAEIIEKAPELLDPNNRTFDELHDKNDELFKQTKFPREATIDAGNMLKLMRLRGKRMESMQGEVQTFSTKKFVNKLAERGQDEVGFHWSDLGMATTICFHGVPPVSFLLGVLGRPPKAKAARKGKDNAAAHVEKINNNERVTMQEMDQSQNKEKVSLQQHPSKPIPFLPLMTSPPLLSQKKDTTEARLKKLTALLTGKDANCRKAVAVAKNEDGKLDMMRLVLNPKSFTQVSRCIAIKSLHSLT